MHIIFERKYPHGGQFEMAKKKIIKLTDEQYLQYIMGLKDDAALFDKDGEVVVPDAFTKTEEETKGD